MYYNVLLHLVTKETQWADPRIAYNLQQQNEKALPVSNTTLANSQYHGCLLCRRLSMIVITSRNTRILKYH